MGDDAVARVAGIGAVRIRGDRGGTMILGAADDDDGAVESPMLRFHVRLV